MESLTLADLPKATRSGRLEDGWESRLWVRGNRAIRLRSRRDEAEWDVYRGSELEWSHPMFGPLDYALLWVKAWLSGC